MNEYHEILERRLEQFTRYLQLMRRRQQQIREGNSYMIFAEGKAGDAVEGPELAASAVAVGQAALEMTGGGLDLDEKNDSACGVPREGWRADDSSSRLVQFSFNPKWFDIDLPNTTLYRAEAEEIQRYRLGFFYVTDRPQFEHPAEKAAEFEPLRRIYLYGDERTAAEDMAFIWFQVWKFPVDWRFFVTAAAFYEGTEWEKDWLLDVETTVPAATVRETVLDALKDSKDPEGEPIPLDWPESVVRVFERDIEMARAALIREDKEAFPDETYLEVGDVEEDEEID